MSGRFSAIVLGDDNKLFAVDAAARIDLLDRELPAFAIRFGEGGQQRVTVDLADLDLALRHGGIRHAANRDRQARSQEMSSSHPSASTVEEIISSRPRP